MAEGSIPAKVRPMSNDPLLQPYRLKHLTLRNRIMTTSHEPAYGRPTGCRRTAIASTI